MKIPVKKKSSPPAPLNIWMQKGIERKRLHHLESEKQRRVCINQGISEIYQELPEAWKKPKMTKAEILDCAYRYLCHMLILEKQLTMEIYSIQQQPNFNREFISWDAVQPTEISLLSNKLT